MAKIYDPLGLVSPIALGGKFLYRDIGSLQSARQRGVRGTVQGVRGMRGTQKNFKKILKIFKNIQKKYNKKKVSLHGVRTNDLPITGQTPYPLELREHLD